MDRFRLTDEQRARLRPGIDPDALERLLSRLPDDDRERFLGFFAEGSRASIVAAANPEMQAMLREVWAPSPGLPVEDAFDLPERRAGDPE